MSQDDRSTPKPPLPWEASDAAPDPQQWGTLPEDGRSWGPEHEPKPLHPDHPQDLGSDPDHVPHGQPNQALFVHPPGSYPPLPYPMQPPPQPHGGWGQMQPYSGASQKLETDDFLAIALTVVLPGTGHMILGQPMKGLATIFCFFISCGFAYLALPFIMYDVYLVSKARKRRAVGEWEVLPK